MTSALSTPPKISPPPTPTRHRRASDGNGSGDSSRSAKSKDSGESTAIAVPIASPTISLRPIRRPAFVHRATGTNDLVHRAGLTTFPPRADLEALESQARPHVGGRRTQYKPFYLLGLGATGNWLYGTGTVAMERGIWARRPVAPPGEDVSALPGVFQPLFGSRTASLAVGGVATLVGVVFAGVSCGLFFQDARRLARKQNTANPSYTRPNAYFAAHVVAIALSVAYRFLTDALRDTITRDLTWAAAVPGLLGQALFAVTQAQAFSSCELQNGKMPLKYRRELGFAARLLIGTHTLYGAMQGVPYLSQYGKEAVRLTAVTAATLAYSLPLTTARLSRQNPQRPVTPSEGPKDSWYSLQVLAAYFAGRFLAGFGPDLVQRGVVASLHGTLGDKPSGFLAGNVFGGAFMLALGTGICVGALMLYRSDVAWYNRRQANILVGMAFTALACIEVYRGLLEFGLNADHRTLVCVAVVPGMIGAGLRLAVLPELFCFSELLNGDLPLKNRYHWTEACRAAAQLGFGVWGSMCAVPDFNPFVREAVGVTAATLATLGMALPTTTSRRTLPQYAWPLSPGVTPTVERDNPFAGIGPVHA